jgi:hypothetical protein
MTGGICVAACALMKLDPSFFFPQTCLLYLFAEYKRIALVTGIGFVALGVMGYLVKLVHIPINNLLVGGA